MFVTGIKKRVWLAALSTQAAVSALAALLELWLVTSTHLPVLRLCSCAENSVFTGGAGCGVTGVGCVGTGGVGWVTGGCGVVVLLD